MFQGFNAVFVCQNHKKSYMKAKKMRNKTIFSLKHFHNPVNIYNIKF